MVGIVSEFRDRRLVEVVDHAARLEAQETYEIFHMSIGNRIDRCESPIERLLAVALEQQAIDSYWGWEPQYEVGNYRADFLVWFFDPDLDDPLPRGEVLVEADGHDFHEKTKDQARHDKRRDRLIQQQGFHIIRFAGSEIYRDPFACAREAYDFAGDLFYRPLWNPANV